MDNENFRREDDLRWLKVQEQIMNLVTAERTDQQELSSMKIEVGKLADHVEDLDDHLRGVAGRESMDSRMVLVERENTGTGILLREIKKQLEELIKDVSAIKIQRAITKESENTKFQRFTAWLVFWGPIIIATLALVLPLTKIILDSRSKIPDNVTYRPDEKLRRQIELDKKSKHAKEVQRKLKALEQIQAHNP